QKHHPVLGVLPPGEAPRGGRVGLSSRRPCSVTHTGSVAASHRPRIGWSPQPLRSSRSGPAVLPMPCATRGARLSACFRLRLAPPPGAGCSEGEGGAVLRVDKVQ